MDDNTFTPDFFDNASKCWRNNKIKSPNKEIIYKCCYRYHNDKRCKMAILKDSFFCKKHKNNVYNEDIHKWV